MTGGRGSRIRLRPMEAGDIGFAMELKRLAGWNQVEADWKLFLDLRPRGCFVATWDGKPAGTVTTIDYEGGIGWISLLLVSPVFRRRGIGTALLERARDSLAAVDCVKLDATPEGKRVYERLGFRAEYGLARWVHAGLELTADAGRGRGARPPVRPARPDDLRGIVALDREVFGRSRAPVLEALFGRAPRYAFLSEDDRGIRGYSFGRGGSDRGHIGPVVARDEDTARSLLLAALRNTGARPVTVDPLLHAPSWVDFLGSLGFRKERDLTRMVSGPNRFPGEPSMQWAIAGPELG